ERYQGQCGFYCLLQKPGFLWISSGRRRSREMHFLTSAFGQSPQAATSKQFYQTTPCRRTTQNIHSSARQLRTRTQQSSNQSQRSSYFPGSAVHQIQNLLSCLISFLRQDQGLMFYLISFLRQDQGLMFYLFAT